MVGLAAEPPAEPHMVSKCTACRSVVNNCLRAGAATTVTSSSPTAAFRSTAIARRCAVRARSQWTRAPIWLVRATRARPVVLPKVVGSTAMRLNETHCDWRALACSLEPVLCPCCIPCHSLEPPQLDQAGSGWATAVFPRLAPPQHVPPTTSTTTTCGAQAKTPSTTTCRTALTTAPTRSTD